MFEDMTIVGKSMPLKLGYSKVTGMLKFAVDRSVAGALWMKVLRSPHPHARIRNINISKASALPGIEGVLTHKDVPQKEILCRNFNWRGKILDERVRYVGDEAAAVVGVTGEVAEHALDLIEVEYEKLPAVFGIEGALEPDAPDVRGIGSNKVAWPPEPGPLPSHQEWGDIEKGFTEADITVEHEVRTSRVYGSFCPPACIAEWVGDKLTLTISHQCPYDVRSVLANTLDIPESKVRVIAPLVAVTMGMLNSAHRFWYLASLLSKKVGKPVVYKMTIEEFGIFKSRETNITHLKMGCMKDGMITALDYANLHDNGGYGNKGNTYQHQHAIFCKANVIYHDHGACTNTFSTGCIRGVGDVAQALAINQAIDMLAEKLAADPLTLWKMNHHKAGDPDYSIAGSVVTLSSEAYDELMDKGAKAVGWEKKWKGWGNPYQVTEAKKRGVGMGIANHVGGIAAWPTSATIEINRDGTAQIAIGFMDLGTNSKTTFAQVGAEVLGIKYEHVCVVQDVDTETVPYTCMTSASTSMFLGGSAIKVAAADAKKQLLEMAHTAPWSPDILKKGIRGPEDLDIKESMIFVKADPDRRIPIKKVVRSVIAPQVIGRALRHDIPITSPKVHNTMVCFADVEVDTETGQVKVLQLIFGNDSGRIVNPAVCKNQVYGGALMSFGYALMEEIALDPATGKALNPALIDYWMPGALDAPPMEIIISDNIDPVGPFGAKGIGEGPTICPHTAIISAIYNAVRIRVGSLPITPDKILRALGKI
ncbi:xanthine dehydrogenase family protein molybdopterin-binding subunit [Chloroflexota bacterium]